MDAYLGQHPGAPLTNLRSLVETPGALLPWRAKALRNTLGRHTDEPSDPQVLKNNEDTRRRAGDRYSVDTRRLQIQPMLIAAVASPANARPMASARLCVFIFVAIVVRNDP